MLEYEFYKNEIGTPQFSIKGDFEYLNELGSCSSEYLTEILDNLQKVQSGALEKYDFGYEVYSIKSKKEISLIIDTYNNWKCITEVSTEEIYALLKKWKKYLDNSSNTITDTSSPKNDLEIFNYTFFDGSKLYQVINQYFDWISSSDDTVWSNAYVEVNTKRIYIIKENVKVLSTFKFYSKDALESLSSKYNLHMREQNGVYYSCTETHNTRQFELSENDDLIVIYCTLGSYGPESIFIYGVYEK